MTRNLSMLLFMRFPVLALQLPSVQWPALVHSFLFAACHLSVRGSKSLLTTTCTYSFRDTGYSMLVGDTLPESKDFSPSGVVGFEVKPGAPAVLVADGGNMNAVDEQVTDRPTS